MKMVKFFSTGQKKPNQWVKILIGVNVVYYLISMVVSFIFSGSGSMQFFSPSGQGLFLMGAAGHDLLLRFHMYFTLVNANFLHANILHIAFNMLAALQLFLPVCWAYGTDRGLLIYLISGVFAFLCSAIMGVQFTVGASGAVFGLMGALLYYGKSRGDAFGRGLFMQIGIWAVLILGMGFMSEGINNVAHLTGLVGGGVLGWFLGYKKHEGLGTVIAANVCLIITVLCLLYPFIRLIRV